MSKEVCPACIGAGSFGLHECLLCRGTGFELQPTFKEIWKQVARTEFAIEMAVAALEKAERKVS